MSFTVSSSSTSTLGGVPRGLATSTASRQALPHHLQPVSWQNNRALSGSFASTSQPSYVNCQPLPEGGRRHEHRQSGVCWSAKQQLTLKPFNQQRAARQHQDYRAEASIETPHVDSPELPAPSQLEVGIATGGTSIRGAASSSTAASNGAGIVSNGTSNGHILSEGGSSVRLEHTRGVAQQLLAADNLTNLRHLVSVLKRDLDKGQLKCGLVRLAQLVSEEPPSGAVQRQYVQSILEDLTEGLSRVVQQYSAQELTSVVCALSRLRYYDGPLLQQVQEASLRLLPSMSPYNASGMLWAFARYHNDFKLPVSADWAEAMLQHVAQDLPACAPSTLSQTLYATALLKHRPSDAWMDAMLQHMQQRATEFSALDISGALWALGTLRWDPGRQWIDAMLAQAEGQTRGFASGTSVASVLWALAVLGHKPDMRFMEHFLWQAQRRFSACDAQNLSNIIWALARLQYRPTCAWCTAFLRAAGKRLAEEGAAHSAQAHCTVLWALAKLQIRPRSEWLRNLAAVIPGRLSHFSSRDLAQMLWSMQRLQFLPGEDWMLDLHIAMQSRVRHFDANTAAVALLALGRYSSVYQVDDQLVNGLFAQLGPAIAAASRQLPSLDGANSFGSENGSSPQRAASSGSANGDATEAAMAALVASAAAAAESMDQRRRSSTTSSASGRAIPPSTLVSLLVAAAKLRASLPRVLHEQLLLGLSAVLEDLSPLQLANACWSVCAIAHSSGRQVHLRYDAMLLPRLVQLTRPHLTSYNFADLSQLARGLACVVYAPPAEWLVLHEHCCTRQVSMGRVSGAQLGPLARAYSRLQHEPVTLAALLQSRQGREALDAGSLRGGKRPAAQGAAPQQVWELRRQLRGGMAPGRHRAHGSFDDYDERESAYAFSSMDIEDLNDRLRL